MLGVAAPAAGGTPGTVIGVAGEAHVLMTGEWVGGGKPQIGAGVRPGGGAGPHPADVMVEKGGPRGTRLPVPEAGRSEEAGRPARFSWDSYWTDILEVRRGENTFLWSAVHFGVTQTCGWNLNATIGQPWEP